jgi:hypothetical protein
MSSFIYVTFSSFLFVFIFLYFFFIFLTLCIDLGYVDFRFFLITRFVLNDPVQGQQAQDSLIDGGWGPVGTRAFFCFFCCFFSSSFFFFFCSHAGTATYAIQIPSAEAQLTTNATITTEIFICNGECGSKHPHSRIFSQATSSFIVTPEAGEVEEDVKHVQQKQSARGFSADRQ